MVLYLPKDIVDIFYLGNLRNANRELLGGASAVSLFAAVFKIIYNVLIWIKEEIEAWYQRRQQIQNEVALLSDLTPIECLYVSKYLLSESQTAYFSRTDGVVGGLRAKNIIYSSSQMGTTHRWAFNLQPWAYKHLSENTKLRQKILKKAAKVSNHK